MPVTFNSNNNYSVDIISESDVSNLSSVQYSSISNTPFVELKITPTNSQTNPVLASNLKINGVIPDFIWNGATQIPQACEPPATPHNTNSSLQHVTGISVTGGSLCTGINGFFGNSNAPQQGPYIAQNDFSAQTSEIAANNVSWSEILFIEVYEDDLGDLINDNHSPAIDENYNHWAMWNGPVSTLNGLRREITTNIYPKYVKAFVYLSFGSNGLAGLTSNTTLNLDIDEVAPTFGCTDPNSVSYNPNATIDDGSCSSLNLIDLNVNLSLLGENLNNSLGYINGPYTSGQTFTNSAGNSFTTVDAATPGFFPDGQNMKIDSATTINLGSFAPGTNVQQLVTFDIIPAIDTPQNGNLRIYNYPLTGGPGLNISQTSGYNQNPGGWGNAKNNLTAASFAIQVTTRQDNGASVGDFSFYQPFYQFQAPFGPPPEYSDWHNSADPTGLQPTKTAIFVDSNYTSTLYPSYFSSAYATEFMDTSNNFEQYSYFPEKVTLSFQFNFIVPYPQGSPVTSIDFDVVLAHNTERQGDFNWTAPVSGCTDPLANNYDPNATIDDGSCAYVNPI